MLNCVITLFNLNNNLTYKKNVTKQKDHAGNLMCVCFFYKLTKWQTYFSEYHDLNFGWKVS